MAAWLSLSHHGREELRVAGFPASVWVPSCYEWTQMALEIVQQLPPHLHDDLHDAQGWVLDTHG